MSRKKTQNTVASTEFLKLSPARIAGIYTGFGLIALYLFDFLLPQYLSGPLVAQIQVLKGAIEVLLTAVLIFVLTYYSERQLQLTNERLEQFTSIVSHDLRNPLHTFEGSLELAKQRGDPEDFERCRQSIYRMRRLIEDLLTLARQGEIIDSTTRVDLRKAAMSAWDVAATEDASLSVETDQVIDADRHRIEQLFGNLYRNAVEHGGPTVTVTVGDLDNGFFVADNGPGIPEEERERVFEPGYSTKSRGTGFGLDIVNQISEAHAWNVVVEESSEGGARFEITGVDANS